MKKSGPNPGLRCNSSTTQPARLQTFVETGPLASFQFVLGTALTKESIAVIDRFSQEEGNQSQEPGDDRLEHLRATLRRMETEGGRTSHLGIAQLKWLISKRTDAKRSQSGDRRTQP